MLKAGYCTECQKDVLLNEDGSGECGHSAVSMSNAGNAHPNKLFSKVREVGIWNWCKQQPLPVLAAFGLAVFMALALVATTVLTKLEPQIAIKVAEKPELESFNSNKPIDKISKESKSEEEPADKLYMVARVIDGETIEIEGGQAVRYIGINTPQTGRPLAAESVTKNKELVEGKQVRLIKDISETNNHGELLRYVYVDNLFVNAELVKCGLAEVAIHPPDEAHADELRELETNARTSHIGIWASLAEPPRVNQTPFQSGPTSEP